MHIERFGSDEVEGIELGNVYVFPKIDGTNGSLWLDKYGKIQCGSRRRHLTEGLDNQGFKDFVMKNDNLKQYLEWHPRHRLYGEWLKPHTLKTYRDDAWDRFYIFDIVLEHDNGDYEYLPYDVYQPFLEEFNLDYIPPLIKIRNGSEEDFRKCLDKNTFLIKDGLGTGEGIVLKNYSYTNKYGRTVWAKIRKNEFLDAFRKSWAPNEIHRKPVEEEIVYTFCTEDFIEKEYAKIVAADGWSSKYIPRLFGVIYHELIVEYIWDIVKKYKNPTINFRRLKHLVVDKIKNVKPELFA